MPDHVSHDAYQTSNNLIRSAVMEALMSRALYNPAVAFPVIYVTEIMSRVDWNIGAAVLLLIGSLAIQLTRSSRQILNA